MEPGRRSRVRCGETCTCANSGSRLAAALSVATAGCVQTRQFADLQFTPPQGDYRLLVLRPDVTRHSADRRRHGRAARRLDRAGPRQHHRRAARAAGGARRQAAGRSSGATSSPASTPIRSPSSSGCNYVVGNSIVLHQYSGADAADQARQGPRLYARRATRSSSAARPATTTCCSCTPRTIVASTGRDRAAGARHRRLLHRFLRADSGGSSQLAYASLVDLRTGEVVWFNVVQTGSQLPGVNVRRHPHARRARRRWSTACSAG